ncbi:MAG TPA: ABC transporter transmembrane domain-containing protein, partial [Solirubrobacterales bacterium]|nr:ABC transporter transmembrane domain-containing protein [Solirubrobacterales bacterium]
MSEASGAGAPADGRPGAGAQLVGSMESEGQRRPKQRDLKPLRELIPFVRDHAGGALIAVFFLMLSTSASLGLTAASRIVVDEGFVSGSAAALNRTFLLLGLVALLLGAATGLRYYFVTRLGERVIADLRAKLYRHILSLDQASFLHIKTGEILSRLTTDIALLDGLLTSSASIALRNFLMMIGAFALLIFVSPRLTGFVVLLAPVVIAPMFVFGRSVRRLSIATQDRFAEAVGFAGESLDAIDTVQAFGREKSAADRFQAAVEAAFRVSLQRIGARAIMTGMVIVLVFGGVTLVLWAGAHSVIAGTMSVG